MKLIYFLGFCVIFVIGLLFSLINLNPVAINFYYTLVDIPLALVLTLELAVGAILGLLVGFFRNFKIKSEYQKLNKQLALAERELENLRASIPEHQVE